ncbi:uncharacterized protein [Clytia hemisphaerica]|uniref:uncharacterized protein isoform X2 n=1 Tax=Clytia hemisphaerica TaxID=252671 RepID=UPI0034D57514
MANFVSSSFPKEMYIDSSTPEGQGMFHRVLLNEVSNEELELFYQDQNRKRNEVQNSEQYCETIDTTPLGEMEWKENDLPFADIPLLLGDGFEEKVENTFADVQLARTFSFARKDDNRRNTGTKKTRGPGVSRASIKFYHLPEASERPKFKNLDCAVVKRHMSKGYGYPKICIDDKGKIKAASIQINQTEEELNEFFVQNFPNLRRSPIYFFKIGNHGKYVPLQIKTPQDLRNLAKDGKRYQGIVIVTNHDLSQGVLSDSQMKEQKERKQVKIETQDTNSSELIKDSFIPIPRPRVVHSTTSSHILTLSPIVIFFSTS